MDGLRHNLRGWHHGQVSQAPGFGEKSDWARPSHPPPIRQQISLSENETKVVEQGPHKPPINQSRQPPHRMSHGLNRPFCSGVGLGHNPSVQALEHPGAKKEGNPQTSTFTLRTAQSALEEHGQSDVYTEANLRRHVVRSCRSTPQTPNYGAGAPKVLSSGFTVILSGGHNPGPKSCSMAYRNFNGPLMLSH